MLPPERRLERIRPLIELKAFFVVHAPRQTGKTTSFQSLAASLTAEGRYAALQVSCKPAASGGDLDRGISALLRAISEEAQFQLTAELRPFQGPEAFHEIEAELRLRIFLSRWCAACPRPVVLFLDEFDALTDPTLQSVLDQLHSGYTARPEPFPQALALIGLRDVREHQFGPEEQRLGTSSPFNIKLESMRLRDFTAEEVAELYAQHTAATGQGFAEKAVARAFELTRGQPWLVNALARQVVEKECAGSAEEIQLGHIENAKEALILRRDTHIDSLVQHLHEPRIRRVVEPILAGVVTAAKVLDDDLEFAPEPGDRHLAALAEDESLRRLPCAEPAKASKYLPILALPHVEETANAPKKAQEAEMRKAIALPLVVGVLLALISPVAFAAEEASPPASVSSPQETAQADCVPQTSSIAVQEPAQPLFTSVVGTQSLHACESPSCANTPGQCSACTTSANCALQCTEFGFGKCQAGKCVCVC